MRQLHRTVQLAPIRANCTSRCNCLKVRQCAISTKYIYKPHNLTSLERLRIFLNPGASIALRTVNQSHTEPPTADRSVRVQLLEQIVREWTATMVARTDGFDPLSWLETFRNADMKTTTRMVIVDPNPGDYLSLRTPHAGGDVQFHLLPCGQDALRMAEHITGAMWLINTRLPDMRGVDL